MSKYEKYIYGQPKTKKLQSISYLVSNTFQTFRTFRSTESYARWLTSDRVSISSSIIGQICAGSFPAILRKKSLSPYSLIVSDAGGGWSQVTIGGGANSLSGYMMSQYLSTDTASVQDATKDMQVVSPYGTQSVVVRDTPSNSYDAVSMLEVGDDVRVIGTKGDYYYVLLDDSSVGCLSTSEAE